MLGHGVNVKCKLL